MDILKQIRRAYLATLLSSRVSKRSAVNSIKNNIEFSELCILCDEGFPRSPNILKYVFGNPLPVSYENLGETETLGIADSLETEINWIILGIRQYKENINLFLFYKSFYEKEFLIGNYKDAEKYLSKIENEVCFSLWSLQNRFLLSEFSQSPEKNKLFLSDFNKKNKGINIKHYAYDLSNRAEKLFSVKKFNDDFQNALAPIVGQYAEATKEHYFIRINKFEHSPYKNFKEVLTIDSNLSIVDRYLLLVDVLKILSNRKENTKVFQLFIESRVHYLVKKINDKTLQKIYVGFNPVEADNYSDADFDLKILDLYTSGLYNEVIENLQTELVLRPSTFENYIFYVKSHLYCELTLTSIGNPKSFQNEILSDLYTILSKSDNPFPSATNLLRKIKQIDSFELNFGLVSFLSSELNYYQNWYNYNKYAFSLNNPRFSDVYSTSFNENLFLESLNKKNPSSISIDFFIKKISEDFVTTSQHIDIPETRKNIELAKNYQKRLMYDEAIAIWQLVLNLSSIIVPVYEVAMFNLFNCYVERGKLDDAIKLYVDSFIINPYLTQKISCVLIQNKIRNAKFKNVSYVIELPLFYTFSNADENEINIAAELFNQANEVNKPSEFFSKSVSLDTDKLFIYLYATCTTENFKHSIYIDGTKERVSERIEILKYLIQNNPRDKATYQEELISLTNSLIIQEGIHQLDESKIYVNESGLINTELKEYEGLFNRYKTIAHITKDEKAFYLLDRTSGKIKTFSLKEGDSKEANNYGEAFSTHPLTDVFKECFDVITEKFLNSKFGISAYLSTRIRHGVLLGELRPIFEKYHLISQKDSNTEEYRPIEYWNQKPLHGSSNELDILQTYLSNFSKNTDDLIYNLIKKNLQIRVKDNYEEGWFDYFYDNTVLSIFALRYKDIPTYTEFVKKIIEILWARTDSNLEVIRNSIDGDVKKAFLDLLTDLELQISTLSLKKQIPELSTNITTCSTEIQVAISKIATWFNRTGSQIADFDLEKIITIIHESLSHSYFSRRIILNKNLEYNPTIKGEYYYHFADLFRIFLDNTLKHSLQSQDEIIVDINVVKNGKFINIEIKNSHPDTNKIDVPKIDEESIDSKKLYQEGKSGFVKAEKILKSDLKSEYNACKFFVDQDNRFCAALTINLENMLS